MTTDNDCARQRDLIERQVAEFKNLSATVTGTEKQLAALKAAHADPATIASVQETLSAEEEQLAVIAAEGKAAVEEFQGECVGQPLPPGAAAFLQTAPPASDRRPDRLRSAPAP
ncbi:MULTISPECIES: hypothetical protein [Kitasatospora]|uniref:Uncharacterized protein n=1 Tax=Kitasatospora cathayae TaxID=3004092 RepID=A0ABY7Q253_9ACTN|nr:hypothetical protein [Kitasatospora sp. HUAS 3-15]WBP86726.1 hypothetical protein O1G21_13340 [Kitasatospora sp. HUAS 3-15]